MHFKNGVKYADDGEAYRLLETRPVASRSGTGATYAVSFWADGSRSCNCVGWVLGAKRERAGQPRCKHLELAGLSDAPSTGRVSNRAIKAALQADRARAVAGLRGAAWKPRSVAAAPVMLLPLRSAAAPPFRIADLRNVKPRPVPFAPEPPVKPTRRLIGEEDD